MDPPRHGRSPQVPPQHQRGVRAQPGHGRRGTSRSHGELPLRGRGQEVAQGVEALRQRRWRTQVGPQRGPSPGTPLRVRVRTGEDRAARSGTHRPPQPLNSEAPTKKKVGASCYTT